MGMSPALAKKLADARASAGGNIFKDGNYVLVIRKLLLKETFNGNHFIPEFDVVDAQAVRDDVEPNKVGTDVANPLNLDNNKSAPGNMKAFFCALLNKTDEELSGQKYIDEVTRLTGDDQPARGMLIEASTIRKVTKSGPNAGKEGVYPRYSHVAEADGNTKAEIAKRRAEMDKGGSVSL